MYPGPGRLILHESKSLVIRDYVKIRYAACGHMKIGPEEQLMCFKAGIAASFRVLIIRFQDEL